MSTYTASTAFQSIGIYPVALSRLRHLDITGRVHFEGPSYVTNADGPILKCRCHIEGRGRLWVAGKGLKLDFFDKLSAKEIFEEKIDHWARLDHPNILDLIGFTTDPKYDLPILVSEWMRYGSVTSFMEKTPPPPIADIHNIALGISSGLEYLHGMNVIHCNIKPENILLDASCRAKICGFSSARIIKTSSTPDDKPKFIREDQSRALFVISQEVDSMVVRHSKETDVWAFGTTVYEILTRRYPLSNISLAQIKTALSEGSAPIWPSSAVPEYRSHKTDSNIYVSLQVMCQRCWGSVSESRPTMGEIRRQLLRSASSKQRLRQLLFESKELDLTKKTPDEYRRRINGGFADIYIRVLDDNAIVAEKSIRFFKNDDTEKIAKRIVRELRVWLLLDHPNVLPLKGFIKRDDSEFPSFVTEWMDNGSLREYAQRNRVDNLMVFQGIAKGLTYLHSMNVVHGDLKADNVVLSRDNVPMLMDFGISHIVEGTETATHADKGSIRWLAPELLSPEVAYHTKESDIWALGMTYLEVLTGKVPYAHIKSDMAVVGVLLQRQLPPAPPDLRSWLLRDRLFWKLCQFRWKFEPLERPSPKRLAKALHET